MGVINAVAQFERDLLIERTQSGLKRAKAEGAVFGRARQRWTLISGRRCWPGLRTVPACQSWRSGSAPAGRPSCGCVTRQ